MTTQTGLIAYIVAFVFTFFAASFLVARLNESPTRPINFLLLVGMSLVWPLTLPLAGAIFLLLGIACLASKLSGS